jgi:hypothetical protein
MIRRLAPAVLLACAVGVIYRGAVGAYFFEDDFSWLASRLTFHPTDLLSLEGRSHFYRPVIELYFWLGVVLFDGAPRVFHLAGIALHILNGVLVCLVARALGMRPAFAWVSAFLFAVQPAYVDAVAWIGAIAETIGAGFGALAILAHVRFRRGGGPVWQLAAAVSFVSALLTHESSIVFLALIGLADWTAGTIRWSLRDLVRAYWPYATSAAMYLVVDLTVNSGHYLITERQYFVGWHMVRNVFEYIASLYIGERTLIAHLLVAVVMAAVLLRGTPRARFAVAWMVVAMLPFLPFTFANVSRYAYLPAVGLALLMGEGLAALDRVLERRAVAGRHAVTAVLAVGLAVRFGLFAVEGVADFGARAETYRAFVNDVRRTHPQMTDGTTVTVDIEMTERMPLRYLEHALQWEYRNTTIRVLASPSGADR